MRLARDPVKLQFDNVVGIAHLRQGSRSCGPPQGKPRNWLYMHRKMCRFKEGRLRQGDRPPAASDGGFRPVSETHDFRAVLAGRFKLKGP
jgi:hypothetical protein